MEYGFRRWRHTDGNHLHMTTFQVPGQTTRRSSRLGLEIMIRAALMVIYLFLGRKLLLLSRHGIHGDGQHQRLTVLAEPERVVMSRRAVITSSVKGAVVLVEVEEEEVSRAVWGEQVGGRR